MSVSHPPQHANERGQEPGHVDDRHLHPGGGDPNGPAAAALLAAAWGCAVLGGATILSAWFPVVKSALNWWAPAGPLTGKVGVSLLLWLPAWLGLHWMWRSEEVDFRLVGTLSVVLLVLGFLGTWPPFFTAFGGH